MKKKLLAGLMGFVLVGSLVLGGGVYAENLEDNSVAAIRITSATEDSMESLEDLLVKEEIVTEEKSKKMKDFTDTYYKELNKKFEENGLITMEVEDIYELMVKENIITREEMARIKEFENNYYKEMVEKSIDERVDNYIGENIINKEEGKKVKEYLLEKNKEGMGEVSGPIILSYEIGNEEVAEITKSTSSLEIKFNDDELGLGEIGELVEGEEALDLMFINEFDELVEKNIITKEQANKMYEFDMKFFEEVNFNGIEVTEVE